MARVLTFRDRALQSRDAVELIAQKWRITILHLLRSERIAGRPGGDVLLR